MGNENFKSQSSLLHHQDTYPFAKIERHFEQERASMKAEVEALQKKKNSPIVQAQIASYSELLIAMNYFQSRGGIIDAQGKHAANLKQIQNELSTSKQNQQQLQSSINQQSDKCQAQDKQLEETRKLQKTAEEEVQSLQNQIQNFQEKYEKEKKGYGQQLSLTQQESQKQKQELEIGIQQCQQTAQKQLTEQKGNTDSKITQMNQENSQLASQLAEITKQIQGLQEELKGYESKEKQLRDQIQQNQS